MLDLVLWQTAAVVTATETQLTAIDSNRVQLGRGGARLRAIASLGANNQYGLLSTPSMGQYAVYTRGVTQANTLNDKGLHLLNPMTKLVESEDMYFSGYQDSGGNEKEQGVAILSYGTPIAPTQNDKPTIGFRFTAGTASVADTWTQIQGDVFSGARELVPGKKYQIVKASSLSATGVAFRFAGSSFGPNRPGGLCITDVGQEEMDFRKLGDMPEFVAGETIDLWAFDTGAVSHVVHIEVQEV